MSLRIQASHGYAVALLPDAFTNLQLDLQYSSPLEALAALNRDSCELAGFHVPRGVVISPLLKQYQQLLKPRAHKIIRFITRQQGLMVRKECSLNINGLEDLIKDKVRFINRQEDSGTRAFFDQLLINHELSSKDITGYNNKEFTHSAVAAYVASNMADAGFGVEQAAHQFGLRFIPICTEDYVFVCHQKNLNKAAIVEFTHSIESEAFQEQIRELAGYKGDKLGVIEDLSHFMPS